ncbi:tRNA pseudouridine(38-40) synthase TruA [Sabulilitoribacter multivorans]|uniref:tRNA pseudouridine synthase A n=1 Tax=Flaviramulus multivorans TaxID=1304750 RepID=A0ABS9ILF9_9FLAO|nr:tRNA pseudouridine(38-40) synthase TruA [Flaviramulus multivorans]MCF7561439.1 tRNA pseudouridine(38-40) synthase TruA [Flaviramulus multivorans]
MRYFLELSYNGAAYHGWQNQPNAVSVQEVLEKALSTLLGEPIAIVGAGRTDAGVHATQMFAHFDTDVKFKTKNFIFKLNAFLPNDIGIRDIFKVKADAHARFDAISRTYLYRVTLEKDVFTFNNTYYVKQSLDVDVMNKASKILFDYKDFQCFSKSNTDVKTYYCDIMQAEWFFKDNELHFVIKANRFLRNMVRAVVGTMINIGLGKLSIDDLHTIIKSKNRSEAGFSVPAHALYLTNIEYPEDIKIHE